MKKVLIVVTALCMILAMCACSGQSSGSEAATNTIQPYELSDEEYNLVGFVAPDAEKALMQFTVDDTFTSVTAGYDYFENGELVKKGCDESETDLIDDDSPAPYGKVLAYVDEMDQPASTIHLSVTNKDNTSTETVYGRTPLSNYDIEDFGASDISWYTSLDGPVDIKKNKKIYIRAEISTTDDSGSETIDPQNLMKDKKTMSKYDKCIAFYLLFK